MKKIILSFILITLSYFESNAQSFILTPSDGYLRSASPDLNIDGLTPPEIRGRRFNGSLTTPTSVLNGNALLRLNGSGYLSGSGFVGDRVSIILAASEAWSNTGQGTWIQFSNTLNGTTNKVERMRLTNAGNLGLGVSVPENKLHIGTGGMTIDHDNSATDVINFKLNNIISAAGIKFNSTSGTLLGGYIHGQTKSLLFRGSNSNQGMTINLNNYIGLNNSNPVVPLHINYSNTSSGSTTGGLILGPLTTSHLTFDGNQIDSWTNTSGAHFYLNYYSNEDVHIGFGGAGAGLDVNGYTNLGDGAPKIKMKKLSGNTSASSTTSINHNLDFTKILDVSVFVYNNSNTIKYAPQEHSGFYHEYRYYVNSTYVGLTNLSTSMQGNKYTVLITYEE